MTELHPERCAEAIWLAVSILALYATLRFMIRPLLIERLRQKLFAIRRGLFLYAYDNKIAFEDRAYVHLRGRINVMLREAAQLSLLQVMLTYWLVGAQSDSNRTFLSAVADVPEEHREAFILTNEKVCADVARHFLLTSPFGWLLLVACTVWLIARATRMKRAGDASNNGPDSSDVQLSSVKQGLRKKLSDETSQLADAFAVADCWPEAA